jgi:hypothetical protein
MMNVFTVRQGSKRFIWTALLLLGLVSGAGAAEEHTGGIPDVMAPPLPQSSPSFATDWVDQIHSTLKMYQANYPTSNFVPYLESIQRVKDKAGQGDRQGVRADMTTFFKMLSTRAHKMNEVAAEELSNFSQMVAPMDEYAIPAPRSGVTQYGTELPPLGTYQ